MIGPCDCPPEQKPCSLCKIMQDSMKRRQEDRRKELNLQPGEPLPCKCSCKCPKCTDYKHTECECEAAKKAGDVPALTCCFNRQSIIVEPTFLSEPDKETLRDRISYWLFRAKCWIEMRRND